MKSLEKSLIDPEHLFQAATNGWFPDQEKEVYHQMLPDFPGSALEWVKHTVWIGPMPISLDQIDVSNRANWVASNEPEKVKVHQDLIKEGKSAPIILGKFYNHDKFVIIDAHHRFLAYEALHLPPIAFIGEIHPADTEAALTAHAKQYSGRSRLDNGNDL